MRWLIGNRRDNGAISSCDFQVKRRKGWWLEVDFGTRNNVFFALRLIEEHHNHNRPLSCKQILKQGVVTFRRLPLLTNSASWNASNINRLIDNPRKLLASFHYLLTSSPLSLKSLLNRLHLTESAQWLRLRCSKSAEYKPKNLLHRE